MHRLCQWILGIFVFMAFAAAAEAAPYQESTEEQAQLELFCAWTDMAAYDDRLGNLARWQIAEGGWDIDNYHESTPTADARFFILHRQLPVTGEHIYILAIPGTETKQDIRVDLKLGKVYFAGADREEFAAAAAQQQLTADMPMVHKGFNEYTQTAFFTRVHEDGRTLGEYLRDELLSEPNAKLYITGHSLGGAVAVLLSARLQSMGVPAEQLEAVTFGAPAAGNAAFARAFAAMQQDRIVIEGDPIQALLQSLPNGYAQFGEKKEWKRTHSTQNFQHSMLVYADAALRHFYDLQPESAGGRSETGRFQASPVLQAAVYMAKPQFELHEDLRPEAIYMRRSLQDHLRSRLRGVVLDTDGPGDIAEICARAREAGCQYVLQENIYGERAKDTQEYIFHMGLQEELYDLDGNLLFAQSSSTSTEDMTPIEALLYNQIAIQSGREEALQAHMEKGQTAFQ